LLAHPAEALQRPADHRRAALRLARALGQQVGVLGQGRVAVLGSEFGQRFELAAEWGGTSLHRPRRAPPLVARLLAPQVQCGDADPEAACDFGATVAVTLACQQCASAQVGR
jgi:hypothetical protein